MSVPTKTRSGLTKFESRLPRAMAPLWILGNMDEKFTARMVMDRLKERNIVIVPELFEKAAQPVLDERGRMVGKRKSRETRSSVPALLREMEEQLRLLKSSGHPAVYHVQTVREIEYRRAWKNNITDALGIAWLCDPIEPRSSKCHV